MDVLWKKTSEQINYVSKSTLLITKQITGYPRHTESTDLDKDRVYDVGKYAAVVSARHGIVLISHKTNKYNGLDNCPL